MTKRRASPSHNPACIHTIAWHMVAWAAPACRGSSSLPGRTTSRRYHHRCRRRPHRDRAVPARPARSTTVYDMSDDAPQRVFTERELLQYNGEKGRPVYIAYKGLVYDVSRSIK